MAGISNELLKLSKNIKELSVIVSKLPDIDRYITDMNSLVQEGVFSQDEVNVIVDGYKSEVMSGVNDIISKNSDDADYICTSSVVESNDKVKNITPIIQGSPVIVPPPTTYGSENVSILSQIPTMRVQLDNILSQIQSVLG